MDENPQQEFAQHQEAGCPAVQVERDRAASGPTAPAMGLYLTRVDYGKAT